MNREKIKRALQELEPVLNILRKGEAENKLSRIETDIILEKLRNIYETISFSEEMQAIPAEVKQKTEEVFEIIQDEKEKVHEIKQPAPELKKEHYEIKKEDQEKTLEEKPAPETEKKMEHEKHAHHLEHEQHMHSEHHKKHVETIADKYQHSRTFLNESLSERQSQDISHIHQNKPLKDIEVAIGFNERFLFIRELFNGDTETYEKTIKILNSASNFNDAFNYINEHFNWDVNGEAAQKILDILRRRFIS